MSKVIFDLPNMDDPEWAEAIEKEIQNIETELAADRASKEHPDRPLPFDCSIWDTEPVMVENRFGGDSCLLPPDAVAVYDCIQGAEMTGNYEMMQKGLDWFRQHFPKEFMILLD
jgi:hypothetical protein